MPMKKNSSAKQPEKSNLSVWMFLAPMKFTVMFSIFLGLRALVANVLFPANIGGNTLIMSIIMLFGAVFFIYKIVRWTPDDQMDHRSFIMLNIMQSLTNLVLMILIGLASVRMQFATNWNFAIFLGLIAFLMIVYMGGIGILKIKSLFCRARMQNVPKWKLWLSMPFGFGLFWYSGFLTDNDKNDNHVLKTKWKSLNTLSSWIVAKSSNTMIAFFVLTGLAGLMMIYNIKIMGIFLGISLILMFVLMFWKKVRNNIGGGFATSAIILNIAAIIAILIASIYIPKHPTIVSGEQIKITEIKK